MTEVVVGHSNKAVSGEELHKRHIASAVLGDAVRDLHHAANLSIRHTFPHEHVVFPVARQKRKFIE